MTNNKNVSHALTPTPPLPKRAGSIQLDENSRKVLERRYVRRDADGNPCETIDEMFWRVAYQVAVAEASYSGDVQARAEEFYQFLISKKFFPNSPTFTGAGTPLGQLAACFVVPLSDDMGKEEAGIFQTLRNAALIQQTGGGNGFSFSRLRPKGTRVLSSSGEATGPVGFLRVYDHAFGVVSQGGARRGANMGVMRVDHPDIEEFVTCKTDENAIVNFNISVGITDDFMHAVEQDLNWDLVFPDVNSPAYRHFDGTLAQAIATEIPLITYKTVRARDLFKKIVTQAHHNGEPGLLFLDAANRANPVPHLYQLETTNPCVTGDTFVSTPQGWRRADSIMIGDEICTVLGKRKVASVELNHGVPVYRLRLSDGTSIRATAAHQFHVRDSRTKFFEPQRLDQIKAGDWIRVFQGEIPNNPVQPPQSNITDREYGLIVGVLVGDGCYTKEGLSKNVVRISTNADDIEWNKILVDVFKKIGVEKMGSYMGKGSRSMTLDPKPSRVIADWIKSLPLEPAHSPEKKLPLEYINSNREFLSGLLDGLFSTDGSVDLQSNHPLLRFHTASYELARQVRLILLMFGVHARIFKSKRKSHAINGRVIRSDRPKYDVTISGASLGQFIEQIQLSHPGKAMRLKQAALRSNFTGGNWAAQVIDVEPDGVETVYDLYEPGSDTWITEGYVSRGCGEQYLGPFESCCLGSVNLAQHFGPDGSVDWISLGRSVHLAVRFLDDVLDVNGYVPSVPQLREAALKARRIGLGIMGLADLMYHVGIRYGSVEGQMFAEVVMEYIRYQAMCASIDLAIERGPFPAIQGSIYDTDNLRWTPPVPLITPMNLWGRPELDWAEVVRGIRKFGIRNAAQTTIAPTGTIATVAGCEGYGCEPAFALGYIRHVNDNSKDLQLAYASPLFGQALEKAGIAPAERQAILDAVVAQGTCQGVAGVPPELQRIFVTAGDITAEEHVRMAAALQAFVDNSISKTINFAEGATVDDVAEAYMLAWRLGAKGITVYVTGSRNKVVLETHATAKQKEGNETPAEPPEPPMPEEPMMLWRDSKKPRPTVLMGQTLRVETPLGKAFVTINEDAHHQPFEMFVSTAKAGSETAAVSEAIGRLVSYVLRLESPISPKNRLQDVASQLLGIGGSHSMGFGAKRVRSLADGIAQVLMQYLQPAAPEPDPAAPLEDPGEEVSQPALFLDEKKSKPSFDICPECGEATFVFEDGCSHCYTCGYSAC
jgi:Ribonucleotide reductase, alpha subunit